MKIWTSVKKNCAESYVSWVYMKCDYVKWWWLIRGTALISQHSWPILGHDKCTCPRVCLNLWEGLWLLLSKQKNVGRPQINSENLESTKLCLLYITVSQQDVISSWTSDWSYLPRWERESFRIKPLFMRFLIRWKSFTTVQKRKKKKKKTLYLNLAKVWNITGGMTQGPLNLT